MNRASAVTSRLPQKAQSGHHVRAEVPGAGRCFRTEVATQAAHPHTCANAKAGLARRDSRDLPFASRGFGAPSSDPDDQPWAIDHDPARSREVGVATEMLPTKAEQVSDDGACAAGLRLKQ